MNLGDSPAPAYLSSVSDATRARMAVPLLLSALLLLGCTWSSAAPNEAALHDRLRYYETLHKDQLAWQHLTYVLPHRTVVRFTTHGRALHLSLTPHPTIWSKDFSAMTEDGHGRRARLSLNRNHFYTGTVLGADGSSVVAHLPADGLLTAVVRLSPGQVYHVERSHLHIHEPHDFHMITYLESDIKQDGQGFLLDSVVSGLGVAVADGHASGVERRRLRRQAGPLQGESCGMAVVADHHFTTGFAEGSASLAANLLITHIMDIDDIYKTTTFRGNSYSFTDFGLQIKRLIVHENATRDPEHYNRAQPFGSDQLLTAFAISDWSDVCLAHLFTYQQFTDGRLGLAYIASTSTAGGICSTTRRFDSGIGSDVSFNSGFSTYLNPSGRRLLQREGIHATAHEIGHGWGSDHDPIGSDTPHLMHPFALSGEEESHRRFSDTSIREIGRVLEVRRSCFQETTQEFCGDGLVGEGEQCDLGFDISTGADRCCNATTCKLLPGATCSDSNHVCCSGCMPASSDRVCQRADSLSCRADATCKHPDVFQGGVNETCPDAELLPAGSECLFGECQRNGSFGEVVCMDTCKLMEQVACSCSSTPSLPPEEAACHICCKGITRDSICEALGRNRSAGFGCQYEDSGDTVSGTCEEGVCVFSADLFRLAEQDPGIVVAFGRFLATNIVGTVAFLVFVVFLIPSLALHFLYDRHYYEKYLKKIHINKSKAGMRKRRKTHRMKTLKEPGGGDSPGREDMVSSQEQLLPLTTTTADGQKITQL